MPYEFLAKNGLISQGNITATGSLAVTQNISASATGSFGIVGIGTTNPATKFVVATSGTGQLRIGDLGFTSNYAGISLNAGSSYNLLSSPTDSTLYINRPSGGNINFRENNSDQIVLLSGGNVGIGSSSPSSKLEVLTSAVGLANQPNIIGNFRGDTDGRSLIRVDNTSTSAGAAALQSGVSFVAYSNTSNQPSANKHEAQIILGSTGATSVSGGQTGTLQIVAPLDIAFNVSASNTIMTGSSYTTFGSNAMYLARSGNVGIGTSSPDLKLSVISGSMRVASGASTGTIYFGKLSDGIYLERDNNYDFSLVQNEASNRGLYLAGAGNVYVSIDANDNETDRAFIVQNNAVKSGTELFRVNEAGRVGVGTSLPTASIHVKPVSLGADLLILERYASQAKLIYAYESAADGYLEVRNGSDSAVSKLSGYSTTPTYFLSNVGVGTTVPSGSLHVRNSSAGDQTLLVLEHSAGYSVGTENRLDFYDDESHKVAARISQYYTGETNNRWGLKFYTNSQTAINSTPALTLMGNNNVGIGTTNPAFLLDVSGSSRHGSTASNVHQFTGSVNINGNLTASNIRSTGTSTAAQLAEKVVTFTPLTGSLTENPAWYRLISGSGILDSGRVRLSANYDNSRSDIEFTYAVRNYDTDGAGAFINITRASTYNSLFNAIRVIEGTLTTPYAIDVLIGNYLNNTSPATVTCLYESQFISAVLDTPTYVSASATGSNSNVVKTVYTTYTSGYPRIGPAYSDGLAVATYQGQLSVGYRGNYSYNIPSSNNYALLVSGSVGIGTTTLGEKLTVSGNSYIIGSTGAVGTGLAYYLGDSSNRDISLTRAGTAALAIGRYYPSAWAETVRFTADGNVGIGTTNPSSRLHISGSGSTTITITDDALYTNSITNDNSVMTYTVDTGNAAASSAAHVFKRYTTELVRIDQDGQVGIGTSDPTAYLHIYGQSGDTANIRLKSSNGRTYDIGSTGTSYGSANNFIIYDVDASAERLRINSSGNVGIGTTSPNSKLEVAGTSGTAIISVNNTSLGRSGSFGIDGSGVYIQNSSNGDYFDLKNATGTSRFRLLYDNNTFLNTTYTSVGSLTSSGSKLSVFGNLSVGSSYGSTAAPSNGAIFEGNVGVGTTSTTAKLHVYASGSSVNLLKGVTFNNSNASFNNASLEYYDTSTTDASTVTKVNYNAYFNKRGTANITGYTVGNFFGFTQIDSGSVNAVWDYASRIEVRNQATASNMYHFIADAGYVVAQGGVLGKATDRIGLYVRSQNQSSQTLTSQYGVYIEDLTSSINNYGIYSNISSAGNKYNIYAVGSADNYFAGNVGIGSTVPGAKLDVVGDLRVKSAGAAIILDTTTTSDGRMEYKYNGTRKALIGVDSDNLQIAADSGNYLQFRTNNTQRMIINNSGGVGIGTSSPLYLFDLYDTGANSAMMSLRSSGSGNARIYFDAANGDLVGSDYCYIGQDDSTLNFVINTANVAGDIHLQPKWNTSNGKLIVSGSSQFGLSPSSTHQFTGSVIGNFTSSRSVGVGFLGTSSWSAIATTLSSSNISQFTNDSKYHYHRTDISSLSSSATNIVQPVSTFDYNNATNGPTNAWYNYFSSTHDNYLTSLIANRHRSADWYVAYKEGPGGTPTNPSWYLLLHTGNYNTYAPTLTGTGASGTWSITSSMANALNSANSYTVGSLISTTQVGGSSGTLVSYVTPGIYANGSSTGNGIALISNTSFANQGAWANIGLHQITSSVNDITAGVYMSIGGWHQASATGLPVYIGGGYTSNSSSVLSVVPTNTAGDGNVGIGTRLPGYKLDVNGDIRAMSGSTIRLQTSAGQERGTFQATDTTGAGGAGLAIATSGGEEIAFKDSADVNMVIKGTGRVGIGTITPAEMLHISSSNNTQLRLESGADAAVQFVGPDTHSYAIGMDDSDDKFKISYNASRTPPGLGTNDRLVITTAGNIGIGATSPSALLHVSDSTSEQVRVQSTGTPTRMRFVNNAGTTYNSYIGADTLGVANVGLIFQTGNSSATTRMVVDVNGKVGIGTTIPTSSLDIIGDIKASSSTINILGNLDSLRGNVSTYGYNLTGSPSGTGWISVQTFHNALSSGDILSQLAYDNYNQQKLFTRYSADYGATWSSWKTIINSDALSGTINYIPKFTGTNSIGNSAIYDSGGNVGIATTAPGAPLDVVGQTGTAILRTTTAISTSYAGLRVYNNLNVGTRALEIDYAGSSYASSLVTSGPTGESACVTTTGAYPLVLGTSNTARMTILGNGNVGIGSASPAYKLDVAGGDVNFSSSTILRFGTVAVLNTASSPNDIYANIRVLRNESTVNTDGMYIGYNSNGTTAAHLRFYANGTNERMRIDASNGNVGIGITNPAAKLSVTGSGTGQMLAGDAGFSGGNYTGISVNGTLNTTAYNILSSPTDTNLYINRPSGNTIYFRESNNDQMVLLTGGNLGIGTSNPSAKVQISGSANSVLLNVKSPISGNIVYVTGSGAVGINTTTPAYTLQVNGSFAATTKSFVIDHPTKPDKKLVYGSLESPYHGIRLTGRDTLVDGKCVVDLPDYISKLIMPETVNIQLTGIKCNKTLYVDDINIKENNFTVAYDKGVFESYKDYDFFWDFTAVRADVPELQTEM